MESFLAGCVPQLHSETFGLDVDGFGDEVNTNSGLGDKGRGTC